MYFLEPFEDIVYEQEMMLHDQQMELNDLASKVRQLTTENGQLKRQLAKNEKIGEFTWTDKKDLKTFSANTCRSQQKISTQKRRNKKK